MNIYKLHFGQKYKILKERILEKHKGYWKAQSIHKLKLKLSSKYSIKDYIMLKSIDTSPKYIPSFISFSNNSNRSKINKKRLIKIKDKLSLKPNINLFITNENQKREEDSTNKLHKKQLYLNLYKDFSYEPYIYNELQFIYLKGKDKIAPRKFSEVLKDCLIMDKYNKLIKTMNYNTNNSHSHISIDNEGNKVFDNNIKITESNNFNNIKNLKESKILGEKTKDIKEIKNSTYKSKNNLKINIKNLSNTAYNGFYKNKKSKGVYTLPTIDI